MNFGLIYLGNILQVRIVDWDHKKDAVLWEVISVNGEEVKEKFSMPIRYFVMEIAEGKEVKTVVSEFINKFSWALGRNTWKAMQKREESI